MPGQHRNFTRPHIIHQSFLTAVACELLVVLAAILVRLFYWRLQRSKARDKEVQYSRQLPTKTFAARISCEIPSESLKSPDVTKRSLTGISDMAREGKI